MSKYLYDLRAYRPWWPRQDLLHFHRVADAFWEAGISVETDSGVSDEGEPWFGFFHIDTGEMVAHFARVSGTYVAFAPFLNGPISACLLPDLVARFLDCCPGKRAASCASRATPAA